MWIQQKLKEVDGKIQHSKNQVYYFEGTADEYGEELKHLESTMKEEGLFCVGCLMSISAVSYYC